MHRASFRYLAGILSSLVLLSACAEPPTREMGQAQGAIDAARAAGADRYAKNQYDAAVQSLKSAQDAVAARDYRLALNHALDSRERAQNAAKEGAAQQVTLRSGAERRLAETVAMLDRAKQRLVAAESARVPRRALAMPRRTIADAEAALQKAGTEIQEGEYQLSQQRLSESATKLHAAIAEIETATKARAGRTRR